MIAACRFAAGKYLLEINLFSHRNYKYIMILTWCNRN